MSLGGPEDLQGCDLPFFSTNRVWERLAAFGMDRLFINHDDVEERGLQICKMRQIYSQAMYVISWLGDDPDNIAHAVKYLFENGRCIWFPGRRNTSFGVSSRGGNTEKERGWDAQRWRISQSFFDLSYWRRVWLIQKIASSGQVKVLFGRIAMDWKDITNALDHWKEHSDKVPKACASYGYAAKLDNFRVRFKDPRPISFFDAIKWGRYALAPMPNYLRTLEQILCD